MLIQLAGTRKNRRIVRWPRKYVSYAKAAKFFLLSSEFRPAHAGTPQSSELPARNFAGYPRERVGTRNLSLLPQVDGLIGRLFADAAAGVLQEHVVQAGLAHLQAGDLHAVPVQ